MEQNCPNCGTRVEDGTPFCPSCGAPQIRVSGVDENDAATPPLPPGTPEELQPPAEPVQPAQRRAWDHVQIPPIQSARGAIDWRNARRAALLSGIIGGFGAFLPVSGLIFLWVLAAGGISITLYQRRVPHSHVTAGNGFRVGALTGLIAALISGFLNMLPMLSQQGRTLFREKVEQQAAATIAANPDPVAQQTLRSIADWAATTNGLLLLVAASILMISVIFTLLAGLGGSIGASLFGKHSAPRT